MIEEITVSLIKILMEENPGKLNDEAVMEAQAVMMYYEQIKKAELLSLTI